MFLTRDGRWKIASFGPRTFGLTAESITRVYFLLGCETFVMTHPDPRHFRLCLTSHAFLFLWVVKVVWELLGPQKAKKRRPCRPGPAFN